MSIETTTKAADLSTGGCPHERPKGADSESFGLDDVFHLLQNQRRRWVLQYLRDVDETVEMGELTEQVAAWEHDTTVDALRSAQRHRVYIALYQRHLPKLDEMGVVDYNQSRGRVTPCERADRLVAYLDVSRTAEGRRLVLDSSESEGTTREGTQATNEDAGGDDSGVAATDTGRRPVSYPVVASVVGCVALVLTALGVSVFATATGLATGVAAITTALLLSIGRLRG